MIFISKYTASSLFLLLLFLAVTHMRRMYCNHFNPHYPLLSLSHGELHSSPQIIAFLAIPNSPIILLERVIFSSMCLHAFLFCDLLPSYNLHLLYPPRIINTT